MQDPKELSSSSNASARTRQQSTQQLADSTAGLRDVPACWPAVDASVEVELTLPACDIAATCPPLLAPPAHQQDLLFIAVLAETTAYHSG